MATAVPDVRLENVVKRFDDVIAVDGISLEIPRGSFFALLGPSGCGKTTTLRMIGGFEQPSSGRIFLGDQEVEGLPPYKRDVNTVFQSYALFPHLTIFENVAFGLRRKGVDKGELKTRVAEVLELVDLTGRERRKPTQLSGGQQQRVALARALVNRPTRPAPRRAARGARPEAAQADAARAEGDPVRGRDHVRPRHARPGGGDDDGRRDRRHERRPHRPAGDAVRALRAAADGVRGRVPRQVEPAPGDGRARTACGCDDGTLVHVDTASRTGQVAVGVRPEKIRFGANGSEQL